MLGAGSGVNLRDSWQEHPESAFLKYDLLIPRVGHRPSIRLGAAIKAVCLESGRPGHLLVHNSNEPFLSTVS